jgi:hypothetical protein
MAAVAPQLRALARDREFEHLYRRYVKDVYHYALALVHNPCDAEDVTQTTFTNAYRAYTGRGGSRRVDSGSHAARSDPDTPLIPHGATQETARVGVY